MFFDFEFKQPLFYKFMKKCLDSNRLSHAYLIETNGVDYANELIVSLIKEILTTSSTNSNVGVLFDSGNYPDFKIIENNEKVIKKEEILKLEQAFSVKPLYGKYLIYLINDAEKLNDSSANALLKFLEEPNDNIIAFLLTKNINSVINTIVSRCQVLSLISDSGDVLSSYFSSLEDYIFFKNNKLPDIINFYYDVEIEGLSLIGNKETYVLREDIYFILIIGLYFYLELFNIKSELDKHFSFIFHKNMVEVLDKNNVNDIIRKIDVISEKLKYMNSNFNKDLFIDNLICDLCGGYYD